MNSSPRRTRIAQRVIIGNNAVRNLVRQCDVILIAKFTFEEAHMSDFFFDLIRGAASPSVSDVAQLRAALHETQWDLKKVKDLAEENLELKLRLAMLIRLLISKGVISAEEYASTIVARRKRNKVDIDREVPGAPV